MDCICIEVIATGWCKGIPEHMSSLLRQILAPSGVASVYIHRLPFFGA